MISHMRGSIAVPFLLLCFLTSGAFAEHLFLDSQESLHANGFDMAPDSVRERAVRLNERALQPGAGNPAQRILLNIFSDASFLSNLHMADQTDEILRWRGNVAGDPYGYAVLLLEGREVSGRVYAFGKSYEISPLEDGLHRIREIRTSVETIDMQSTISYDLQPAVRMNVPPANIPVVQVLIVYSEKAVSLLPSPPKRHALMVIDEANMILMNSGATARFDFAGFVVVPYDETGEIFRDLDRITIPDDGVLDQIHALRNRKKADAVVLVVSYRYSFGGAAHQQYDLNADFSPLAFSVIRMNFGAGTFAHEMGHLLGSTHDHCENGIGIMPYSFAYENFEKNWTTIMSNGTCFFQDGRQSWAHLLLFSTPKVKYQGDRIGTAPGAKSAANNAKSLFFGATAGSQWRLNCKGRGTPRQVSPADSASSVDPSSSLQWKAGSWPWFELEVAENPSFSNSKSYLAVSRKISVPLKNGRTYYWRVKGRNDCGESGYSDIRQFTTAP